MIEKMTKYLFRLTAMLAVTGLMFMAACSDDDDTPEPLIPAIGFASGSATLQPDAAPVTVNISFTSPALEAGDIVINVTNGANTESTDYTTNPAASGGKVTVSFELGASSASFTVGTNASTAWGENNRSVAFTLESVSGSTTLGTASQTFNVTLVSPGAPEPEFNVVDIADIRALGLGGTIEDDVFIEGYVVTDRSNITFRNVYIHDETAGILVRFATNNETLDYGDKVRVEVSGITLTAFQGVLQIEGPSLEDDVTELEAGDLPEPVVVTIDEVLANAFEGRLIKIENVFIKEADGVKTLGGANTFSDGTNELRTFVRTNNPKADFADDIAPVGVGSITGIMTSFGNPANSEIMLRGLFDVENIEAAGSITVTESLVDFGEVANAAASDPQEFTVQGNGLINDVLVEASTNFEVSLDNDTWASSVDITAADANAGPVNVFVRFSPATGSDQSVNGTVSVSSIGAEGTTINVSGTETGNGVELRVETFTGIDIGNSYTSTSFTGVTGVEWSVVAARNDGGYPIDGDGIMLRRDTEPSTITATINNGVGNFSIKLRKAFTGGAERQVELFINGESKGTSEIFGNSTGADATIIMFEVENINVAGEFTLELRNIKPGQLVIDDLSWTPFEE